MRQSLILQKINRHKPQLKKAGVKTLSVFGSYARGEQHKKSDLDVLVELQDRVDLFDFMDIKELLEKITQHSVDLATPTSLKPHLRADILAEAKRVF
jgi:uncharacterized protein